MIAEQQATPPTVDTSAATCQQPPTVSTALSPANVVSPSVMRMRDVSPMSTGSLGSITSPSLRRHLSGSRRPSLLSFLSIPDTSEDDLGPPPVTAAPTSASTDAGSPTSDAPSVSLRRSGARVTPGATKPTPLGRTPRRKGTRNLCSLFGGDGNAVETTVVTRVGDAGTVVSPVTNPAKDKESVRMPAVRGAGAPRAPAAPPASEPAPPAGGDVAPTQLGDSAGSATTSAYAPPAFLRTPRFRNLFSGALEPAAASTSPAVVPSPPSEPQTLAQSPRKVTFLASQAAKLDAGAAPGGMVYVPRQPSGRATPKQGRTPMWSSDLSAQPSATPSAQALDSNTVVGAGGGSSAKPASRHVLSARAYSSRTLRPRRHLLAQPPGDATSRPLSAHKTNELRPPGTADGPVPAAPATTAVLDVSPVKRSSVFFPEPVPGAEPQIAPAAAAPALEGGEASGQEYVRRFLQRLQLDQYSDAIIDAGYDCHARLALLDAEALKELAHDGCVLKPAHRRQLERAVAGL